MVEDDYKLFLYFKKQETLGLHYMRNRDKNLKSSKLNHYSSSPHWVLQEQ